MTLRPRIYDQLLREQFARQRQMALVSGPSQVGKTTTCRALAAKYLNCLRRARYVSGKPCKGAPSRACQGGRPVRTSNALK